MKLSIHSDALYLSVSQVRSRASGVNFLSEGPPKPQNTEDFVPTVNGIILVVCKIMRNIMVSAAEAEYYTIFVDAQTDVPICTTLTEMGWKQGPTSIQVVNSTAVGIATKEFRQKKSKAMDMQFYWINYIIEQGQFRVFWIPGPENLGNYHSKHHPPKHHIAVQSKYLHVPKLISLHGCVKLTIRVNPTKQKSQRAKLQHYFLEFVSEPLQLINAQSNARVCTRVGERTHNLLPSMELHKRGARTQNRLLPMISLYDNLTCNLIS